MKRIQNKRHQIATYDINKISLPCFDDKRYILDNGFQSLAYFHSNIVVWFWDNLSYCSIYNGVSSVDLQVRTDF